MGCEFTLVRLTQTHQKGIMNKAFKIVFNKSRGLFVVADELSRGHHGKSSCTKRTTIALLTALAVTVPTLVGANPFVLDDGSSENWENGQVIENAQVNDKGNVDGVKISNGSQLSGNGLLSITVTGPNDPSGETTGLEARSKGVVNWSGSVNVNATGAETTVGIGSYNEGNISIAGDTTVTVTGGSEPDEVSGAVAVDLGANTNDGAGTGAPTTLELLGSQIQLNASSSSSMVNGAIAVGINAEVDKASNKSGTVTLGQDGSVISIKAETNNTNQGLVGIANSTEIALDNIAAGIFSDGAEINVQGASLDISSTAKGYGNAVGISVGGEGVVTVNADKLKIVSKAQKGDVDGVKITNGSQFSGNGLLSISVTGSNDPSGETTGLEARAKGTVNWSGSVNVNATGAGTTVGIGSYNEANISIAGDTTVTVTGGSEPEEVSGAAAVDLGANTNDGEGTGAPTTLELLGSQIQLNASSSSSVENGAIAVGINAEVDKASNKSGTVTLGQDGTVISIKAETNNTNQKLVGIANSTEIALDNIAAGIFSDGAEINVQGASFDTSSTAKGYGKAVGISVSGDGVVTVNADKLNIASKAQNNTAMGVSAVGSELNLLKESSFTVQGKESAYGVYAQQSTVVLGQNGSSISMEVTADNAQNAYAIFADAQSSVSIGGNLDIKSGLISSGSTLVVEADGGLKIADGLNSVTDGTKISVNGTYTTVSSDIFNVASGKDVNSTGGVNQKASSVLTFNTGSNLILEDAFYTKNYLNDAVSQFAENAPSITMTGELVGDLTIPDLQDLPNNSTLVEATLVINGSAIINGNDIQGSYVGVGSVSMGDGDSLVITSDTEKTFNIIGRNDKPIIESTQKVTVSVEKSASLVLGGDFTAGGEVDGSLSAKDSAQISFEGTGQGGLSQFTVTGSITTNDSSVLSIKDAASLLVNELVANEGSLVQVGSSDKAGFGKLIANIFNLKGSFFIDPVWIDGQEAPSSAAFGQLTLGDNANVTVGRNSTLVLGSTSDDLALKGVHESGHQLVENDIQAALYVASPLSIGTASIVVDGTLDSAKPGTAGQVSVNDNAMLIAVIDDKIATGEAYLFTGDDTVLNFASESYLHLDLSQVTTSDALTIQLAETVNGSDMKDGHITGSSGLWYNYRFEDSVLKADFDPTNSLVSLGLITPNVLREGLMNDDASLSGIRDLISKGDMNGAVNAMNSIAAVGAASGVQLASLNASNMISETIQDHVSVLNAYNHKEGADLWIELNGYFSKASDYKIGSAKYGYKSDIGGITIGADYGINADVTAGAAVSFGMGTFKGRGLGSGVKNSLDYIGFNAYGSWKTPYVDVIGNIGYLYTHNEVSTSYGPKVKPKTQAVTAEVRVEKGLAVNDSFTVTPHAGIRYTHVKADDMSIGGFKYENEKADLLQIPFGVSVNGNFKASCGATVKPFADFTVVANAGDKKVNNRLSLQSGDTFDTLSTEIANTSLYRGKVGLKMTRGAHSLNGAYSIGGGNRGRLDQALGVQYRYEF